MRLVIAGGRDFNDAVGLWDVAKKLIDENTDFKEKVTVLSGTCRGADMLGEDFAEMEGYAVERFPADWDGLGKRASFVRNEQMAKTCTHVLVFWDGKSLGTKMMIELASKHSKPCRVVRYVSGLQREVESNMANVKGSLKVIKKNDFGFYSVKIDDTWYGLGTKNEPSGYVTGDTVEGEFELEKGKYKTITKAGLRKVTGNIAPDVVATKTSGGSTGGTDWAAKDASIRYQSSRKDALAFLGLPGVLEGILGKAKPADKLGIIEATLDRYTAAFHEDVATFGAVTRASAVAVDPQAPASDEDDE